ncbi:MAG: ROK family protein [Chloroflexi bacterium]|nr:ROK family protein [Chloroflexota bacterium]
MPFFGGIEAGGTKFVCAVGTGPDDLRAETRFPTTTPEETIGQAIAFFKEQAKKEPLAAIGIASFGPVDPNPASPTFGYITTTPKPHWANTDLAGSVSRALSVPVGFDTDVNGAALGEYRWGTAQSLDTFIYLTIGICILSPQRIVLGGGVMEQAQLFPLVRRKTQELLNGYVQSPEIIEQIDRYIVPPGLGSRAGVLGAIALAEQQLSAG